MPLVPFIPDIPVIESDLVNNITERIACLLVLDGSSSMAGEPMRQLNQGLQDFARDLKNDPTASVSVQIGVIRFGGHSEVEVLSPFTDAMNWEPPTLEANGTTPLGAAMQTALKMLREQKDEYKKNAISYKRPWLVLMTDGEPTDDANIPKAERDTKEAIANKGVFVLPVGCGDGADMDALNRFVDVPARGSVQPVPAQQFKDIGSWRPFFMWLSESMAQVSSAQTGETQQIPAPVWNIPTSV